MPPHSIPSTPCLGHLHPLEGCTTPCASAPALTHKPDAIGAAPPAQNRRLSNILGQLGSPSAGDDQQRQTAVAEAAAGGAELTATALKALASSFGLSAMAMLTLFGMRGPGVAAPPPDLWAGHQSPPQIPQELRFMYPQYQQQQQQQQQVPSTQDLLATTAQTRQQQPIVPSAQAVPIVQAGAAPQMVPQMVPQAVPPTMAQAVQPQQGAPMATAIQAPIATAGQHPVPAQLLPTVPMASTMATPEAAGRVSKVEDVANPKTSAVQTNFGMRQDLDNWVSDGAHALSPTDFATLNALVNSVYEMYGMEICVVTVDDVESCRDGHGLHGFATKLFNKWSIGDKKTGNGMLLLWVKDQRTVEIVTGEGQHMGAHRGQLNKKGLCRVLPDRWCRNELSRWYIPYFKAGQFGTGLMRAVQRVVEQVQMMPWDKRQQHVLAQWKKDAPGYQRSPELERLLQASVSGVLDSANSTASHLDWGAGNWEERRQAEQTWARFDAEHYQPAVPSSRQQPPVADHRQQPDLRRGNAGGGGDAGGGGSGGGSGKPPTTAAVVGIAALGGGGYLAQKAGIIPKTSKSTDEEPSGMGGGKSRGTGASVRY